MTMLAPERANTAGDEQTVGKVWIGLYAIASLVAAYGAGRLGSRALEFLAGRPGMVMPVHSFTGALGFWAAFTGALALSGQLFWSVVCMNSSDPRS
jgi:hypothetical protein